MNPLRRLLNWFGERRETTLTHEMLGLSSPAIAGVHVDRESAFTVSAVFCADRVLHEGVATLPKKVYRERDGVKERTNDHPVAKLLWRNPNPEMTAPVLWGVFQHNVNIWGYGALEIVRDGSGAPRELWPLTPFTTRIERKAGRLVFNVPAAGGGRTDIPRDDVFFVPGPTPDGSMGFRFLHYARMTLGLAIAAQRFGTAVFSNGHRPGSLLKAKGRLSKEARENLRESWRVLHGGPDNAGKPAILEEGLEHEPLKFVNNEQLQLQDLLNFVVIEVARFFNVSPVKLHDLGRATWSNVEQLDTDFVRTSLRPHLVKQEHEANGRLFLPSEQDHYVEHLIDELMRADTQTRYAAYGTAIDKGFMTINEVRAAENRPPLPGGDVLRIPLNTGPAAAAGDPKPEPTPPAPDGPDGTGNPKPAE